MIRKGDKQDVLADISLLDEGVMLPQMAILGNMLKQRGMNLSQIPITQKQAQEIFSEMMEHKKGQED